MLIIKFLCLNITISPCCINSFVYIWWDFSRDDVNALVDDLVINTKKLMDAASKEIDKWRR